MKISEKTIKTLETANQKEPLICGYNSTQIQRDYLSLINGQKVEVGYRAGCGKKDKTHKIFEEWLKVIKSLKKDGFIVNEENVVHPNKSPTMAQGFWNSIIYSINI
jgi:hypothetical protein